MTTQQNKELESVIKHKEDIESSSTRSTPLHRNHASLKAVKSSESFHKTKHHSRRLASRSSTVET